MAKHWIQGAIKHPGALTKKANAAGQSPMAFAAAHKNSGGTTGKQANLALTLSKLHGSGPFSSSEYDRGYKTMEIPGGREPSPASCSYQDDEKYGRKENAGPSGHSYRTERPDYNNIKHGGGSSKQAVKDNLGLARRGEAKQVAGISK